MSFSPFSKAQNHPDALNGPFFWFQVDLSWEGLTIFIRVEGSHKILLQFGREVCQPCGAAWKREVGPVQDTLLSTPVFHMPAKSLFEGWSWGLMELKKNVEKAKQVEKGCQV